MDAVTALLFSPPADPPHRCPQASSPRMRIIQVSLAGQRGEGRPGLRVVLRGRGQRVWFSLPTALLRYSHTMQRGHAACPSPWWGACSPPCVWPSPRRAMDCFHCLGRKPPPSLIISHSRSPPPAPGNHSPPFCRSRAARPGRLLHVDSDAVCCFVAGFLHFS